jgi:serine/threonine-protein kinase HipA
MSEPAAFVHVDIGGVTRFVGQLYVTAAHGRTESATFRYDTQWIAASDRFALEPALALSRAPHHTLPGQSLFGALGDSAPDRWGQTLLRRAERMRAAAEGRAPRSLRAIDFLLGVTDTIRLGALRFALREGGPFVAPEREGSVPPLVHLPRLLAASERFLEEANSDEDLRLLLAPGSSLGGARPKASVRDRDGSLLIAKFPNRVVDDYRVVAWEAVALTLADAAGLHVARHRLERAAERDVLLLSRFDRRGDANTVARVPFLSAMSMLGAFDGETRSYPELADAIRQYGSAPRQDLRELWRRMVFSVLVSNGDDHLRNHGFLLDGVTGWRLSPAYDVNPVPVDVRPRLMSTALGTDGDLSASLEIAFESAPWFGIDPAEARTIAAEVGAAVSRWRDVATQFGIAAAEQSRMATAFEHDELALANRAAQR